MAVLTTRFPSDISFGAEGGPYYKTDIVEIDSGYEYRNQAWSQSKLSWDVSHSARPIAKARTLLAFFRMARGRTHSFRFKDWMDYQCPDDSGTGVFTLLTATTFQFYKRYGSGGTLEDRKITRLVTGTVTVTGGVSPSIDYDTGIVTVASGTPTSWVGEFDVLCRFDTDSLKQEMIDKSGNDLVVGWGSIPVIEVRE